MKKYLKQNNFQTIQNITLTKKYASRNHTELIVSKKEEENERKEGNLSINLPC